MVGFATNICNINTSANVETRSNFVAGSSQLTKNCARGDAVTQLNMQYQNVVGIQEDGKIIAVIFVVRHSLERLATGAFFDGENSFTYGRMHRTEQDLGGRRGGALREASSTYFEDPAPSLKTASRAARYRRTARPLSGNAPSATPRAGTAVVHEAVTCGYRPRRRGLPLPQTRRSLARRPAALGQLGRRLRAKSEGLSRRISFLSTAVNGSQTA